MTNKFRLLLDDEIIPLHIYRYMYEYVFEDESYSVMGKKMFTRQLPDRMLRKTNVTYTGGRFKRLNFTS